VIILTDSAVKWHGYLIQKKPYTTTEVGAEKLSPIHSHPTR
jgi:hypothetical protein